MPRLKWSFKKYIKFLKDYGFKEGYVKGSHYFLNGRIKGKFRVVQVIHSKKEKEMQSQKTIKIGMRHSGIPKEYWEEWDKNKKVHKEIII